jgi:branched-subunit amino acid aminotransferase/4-amino-4-deoxychorismate lyase
VWLKIKAYAPKRNGFEVIEKILVLQEVYTADEVFLTSSEAEVVPVNEIDDRNIGTTVPDPITGKLMEAYKKYAKTECVTPYITENCYIQIIRSVSNHVYRVLC